MRARLVVFPVRGRNWCFSRSMEDAASEASNTPSTLKDVWRSITTSSQGLPLTANAHLLVDFVANKMNGAWTNLEKAPSGSFKNKIHGLGLRLMARVRPSEVFLKSISKDVSTFEVTYPSSLNARFVRRRLRHIAMRGTIIHKRYFYGSVSLIPLASAFTILPLPNIPLFWILFRTYSHWQALQGSKRLLQLLSDGSHTDKSSYDPHAPHFSWVMRPSDELERLIGSRNDYDGVNEQVLSNICNVFALNINDAMKYHGPTY